MKSIATKSLYTALLLGLIPLSSLAIKFDSGITTNYNGNEVYLIIGAEEPNNSITITNGSSGSAEHVIIGQDQGSNNNQLFISGNGSELRATNSVSVGPGGATNKLHVEDSGNLLIGNASSDFSNGSLIAIGSTNNSATLTMKNGSSVTADRLVLGSATNHSGSVSASGKDTSLILNDSAYIGESGSDSLLTLSSGATMTVSNILQVGSTTGTNNVLRINRGGKLIISGTTQIKNSVNGNKIELNGGHLSYHGDANLGTAADNGYIIKGGSTLEIGGKLTLDQMNEGFEIILNGALSESNAVWDSSSQALIIGDDVGGNTLTLTEGASVISGSGKAKIGNNSNGNILSATGTGTVVNIQGGIRVGQNGSKNEMNIEDGATASITEDLIIGRSGNKNTFSVTTSTNTIASTLVDIGSDFTIGKFGNENSAIFSGSNSTVTVGGNLFVGESGNKNTLNIKSGAQFTLSGSAYVGTNGANNSIEVAGTNSYLEIADSLWLGNSVETNANTGNILSAFDTASISIGDDLRIYNGSTLKIEAGSQITVGGNYYQDETSEYALSISTNSYGMTGLVVGGSATFASNTTITVYDDGTATNTFEQIAVSSSALYLGDTNILATTDMLNDTNIITFVNDLLYIGGIVTNNSIVLTTEALSLSDRAGLTGTYLEPLGDEIDKIAFSGSPESTNAIAMRNILGTDERFKTEEAKNKVMYDYYGEKESSIPANNMINLGIQNVAEQLTMRADNTRTRQGMASSQANFDEPAGAAGPHETGQELQGWISFYGSKGSMDAADGFYDYDVSMSGFLIGADMAYNENILVGLAGGSGSSSIDKESADIDTKTIYGTAYASIGTEDWFTDISLIYGNSDVDATLGSAFDTKANYTAHNVAMSIGGGKEIGGDYLIFTPGLSFLGNIYMQESYEEESTTAVARKVDRVNTFNLQSALGGSLAMYLGMGEVTFKPELRAFWMHEWIGDEERVDYSLIGGTGSYSMLLQAPEKDIFKIGIGSSAQFGEYLELRADLDTRFGKDYSDYTLQGSLRYQF